MECRFIEASQNAQTGFNWGKFMVARFTDEEWEYRSRMDTVLPGSLLRKCGWDPRRLLVMDLQTGEGALFQPGGSAHGDLGNHRIWVCVLFEAFLSWLYSQDVSDLAALPEIIELPDAPAGLYGYRRPGPAAASERAGR
jgi:hypothetical protein